MAFKCFFAWAQNKIVHLLAFIFLAFVPFLGTAQAQASVQTEENFRDLFLTAAYSAAFGAAFGAALLPFFPGSPQENLRYITGGASVGFMGGSAFAFYNFARMQQNHMAPADDQSYYGSPTSSVQMESWKNASLKSQNGFQNVSIRKKSITRKPSGALLVGRNSDFGMAIPAVSVGQGSYGMQLVRYEH